MLVLVCAQRLPALSASAAVQQALRSRSYPPIQDRFMEYATVDLSPRERYKILTSFVLPRPIAWVTTLAESGAVNAAPFSFFNVLGEDPPLCVFAINLRPDGRVKDTLINIRRTSEFVVHITDEPL